MATTISSSLPSTSTATLSSPGIGSGLDVNGLVSKLMQVESLPLTNLNTKEASYQAQLTAFGTVKSALAGLQSAAQALTQSSVFTSNTATTSDDTVLTGQAAASAAPGTYNIAVTHLAKNNTLRTNGTYGAASDTFNAGSISITVGAATKTIAVSSANNTVAAISQAINDANAGVSAAVIYDGTTNRIVLTSNTSGTDGAISVAVTDTGSGGTHALTDFSTANLVEVQPAQNAQFTVNGLSISRPSNIITDIIPDVAVTLTKEGTVANPATARLEVARDPGAASSAINTFVTAYNAAVQQLSSVSAFNTASGTGSILTGDSAIRDTQSQLARLLRTSVGGLSGGISTLVDLGITLQKDGTLAVKSGTLQAALKDPSKDIAGLFTSTKAGNQGVMVAFSAALNNMLGSSGEIASRTDGINASIDDIGKRRDLLQAQLATIQTRYRAQFNNLDTVLSSMQTTSSFLTQQLSILSNLSTGSTTRSTG